MSLYKQLWLAIIFLLALVFTCSFIVSSLSARAYLEQQLAMKNSDNATALALSLSQQEADEVLLELTIAAQFDTGFYELIELVDPEGNVVVRRGDPRDANGAPAWFMALFPIEVAPGVASVQSGWQQLGTLTLRSHSKFAYQELWRSTQGLALVFIAAIIVAGLLGTYLLRIILRPLDEVVEQAGAIGERRFITIPEPKTQEFRKLVNSMNGLSERVKQLLQQEARRLEKWQRDAHLDKVSGLLNREPFLQSLDAALESDDVNATGTLSLIRLRGLAQLNQVYGRKAIDGVIHDIGSALSRITMQHSRWAASRLNGSDFAVLAPRALETENTAREIQDALHEVLESHSMRAEVTLPGAATVFAHGDTVSEIMTRLDGALLSADTEGGSGINVARKGDIQMKPIRDQMDEWRSVFEVAFREGHFTLQTFPVVGLHGELLHMESPVRLRWQDETLAAGRFLPWINRLELSGELDKRVTELALAEIERTGQPMCINLSVASVVEPAFLSWLSERLSAHDAAAANLWLEVPESMAFRHLENFKHLCTRARAHKCKVGIEHMGHQLAELGRLHDIGVDYLKVDASFVRGIDDNPGNQTLLRTLCTVGHSIGVIVIGESVRTEEEWAALKELGADGATGPGISYGGNTT
jgi:EAL domain-containing protein (putative c-di-GMP-specific phosphodiesterase class I)/GGDEF domain-containing protein